MKLFRLTFITIILILAAYGLFLGFPESSNTNDQKPTVAATLFPLYDIVKNIAGDQINVVLILPPGASPHTFEPTPTILREVGNAQTVFMIGHGLDDWTKNLVDDSSKILAVDNGIALRPDDPHYFLTGKNAILISQTVADSLKSTFPELSETIIQNQKLYQIELEKMDEQIKSELASVKNRDLITFHDAWYYFAEEYGLNIAGTFEPTVGREPTPQYLAELSQKIKETGVRVLYAEPQFSTRGMEAFLKDHDISVATVDPEGGGAESTSYINMMISNARTIAKNQ
ncbi:zinc ABC transporter substrate-binding protein [Candidatus Uhrbacteria bacterium]|nr:zinc ABC transporter substrate-binding protein [Candidatus Uhrbacteria bacterium]